MGAHRRAVCVLLCLLLAALPADAQQEEAAWALWQNAMERIAKYYYQPTAEPTLTHAALTFLAEKSGPSALRLLPPDCGPTAATARAAYRKFLSAAVSLPGRKVDAFSLTETALENIAIKHLDFCRYERLADVEAAAHAGDASVGLRLDLQPDGRVFCLPREGAPAWRAGIRRGDELLSIDDQALRGLPRLRLRSLLRGAAGSVVMLQATTTTGKLLRAGVRRESDPPSRPGLDTSSAAPVLRIPEFTADTTASLKAALAALPAHAWLTIDLRGNGGGDLLPAVDSAGLFLPGPRPLRICTKTSHAGTQDLQTHEAAITKPRGILILVDAGTASSAELFALALLEASVCPVTIGGTKTYGKGLFQEQQVLDGGGLFSLTVGQLRTSRGTAWHQKGIQPTFANP